MIEINSLTKNYASEYVLNNITLQLSDNNIYFLMGSNGSGKTTFIKCLLSLEAYNGIILFSGSGFHDIRHEVFPIFDDIPLYNDLNGYQNIRIMLGNSASFHKNEVIKLQLLTDYKLRQLVKNYSLGERKKLAMAAAIIFKETLIKSVFP